VYLLPYEFLFRGLLLPYSLQRWDFLTAFLVNTLIYTAAHWQQGKREITGAFFMGWITCYVTYFTGNFWSAFVVHLALALSNSYITVARNRMSA
jgi:membrane protease YdiL (CAAX protease family)